MAYCNGLENRHRGDPIQGSNPCPSAEGRMNPRGAVVPTLYQRVLGTRFGDLHPVLRRFHSSEVRIAGRGLFRVVYHPGWFRMVLLFASPFPPAGEGVEVASEVSPTGAGERWVRSFAGRPLVTWQTHRGDLLLERSGPPLPRPGSRRRGRRADFSDPPRLDARHPASAVDGSPRRGAGPPGRGAVEHRRARDAASRRRLLSCEATDYRKNARALRASVVPTACRRTDAK